MPEDKQSMLLTVALENLFQYRYIMTYQISIFLIFDDGKVILFSNLKNFTLFLQSDEYSVL